MLLTLDSSLFVAALRTQEPEHQMALAVLQQVVAGQHVAIEPLTVLVEVVAAIRRRTGSMQLAERIQNDLLALPNLRFVEFDHRRALAAAETARLTNVRGMDAIIVAAAREFGSALVTLDAEIQQRTSSVVTLATVADAERAGHRGMDG